MCEKLPLNISILFQVEIDMPIRMAATKC